MQLFRQIILKNYQKYVENKLNNRFFPYELAQSIMLVHVILKYENDIPYPIEKIVKLNKLFKLMLTEPYNKVKYVQDTDEQKKLYNYYYSLYQRELEHEIENMWSVIYQYIKEFKIDNVIEFEKRQLDGKGVVAIIYPHYSYEVDMR